MNSLFKGIFYAWIAGLAIASSSSAVDYYWKNPTWGYVNDPANWDDGSGSSTTIPGQAPGDRAIVNNGGLALIDATHTFGASPIGSNWIYFSYFAGVGYPSAGPGGFQQSGSTVNSDSGMILGYYGTEASYGYYGISGGSLNAKRATGDSTYAAILVGHDHPAVFNQTGGATTTVIAPGDGARTIVGWSTAGATIDSLMNIRGGSFGISGGSDYAFLLGFGGRNSVLNLGGVGTTVDLTGGGATPIGRMLVGGGGVSSVVNLGDASSAWGGSGGVSGGGCTLTTASIHGLGASATVNFHGGTLRASTAPGDYTLLDNVTAYVHSEGAVIDTNGFNAAVAVGLDAPSGNGVSGVSLASGGGGFIGEPIVTLTDEGGTGSGATARAIVDLDPASPTFQQVTQIVVTNPGVNYTGPIGVSFTGGGPGAVLPVVASSATAANVSGGLTKTGLGNLTLNARCTYTGPTVVEAGKLTLGGIDFAGSGIAVKSGATLAGYSGVDSYAAYPATTVEAGGTIAASTGGAYVYHIDSLNLAGNSNLNFTIDALGFCTQIQADYSVSKVGAAPINVNVSYNGTLLSDATVLQTLYGTIDRDITFSLPGGLPAIDSDDGIHAQTSIYTDYDAGYVQLKAGGVLAATQPCWNKPGGGNWNDGLNWGPPNAVPDSGNERGLFIQSLGGGEIPVSLNVSPTLSSLIFASPAGEAYTITPAGSETITLHSSIAKDWHITVHSGTHTVGAGLKLGAGAGQSIIRSVDDSHLTLSGVVSDETTAAGVRFEGNFNGGSGTGVLTLLGANTYSGPTSVKNGVLEIGSIANVGQANSLGRSAASPANLILDNATLNYLGTAAATTDRGMTVSGVSAIRLGGDVTFAAAQIAGANSQSLALNGPGKITFDSSSLTLTDETDKGKLWIGDGTATVLSIAGSSEVTARSLLVGKAGGSDAGKGGAVYQTGGVVNVLGDGINPYDNSFNGEIVGHSAYGYYNISGGTLNMNVYARSGYNPFIIGLNAPAVFDQTGGIVNNPGTSNILIGANGTAALNVTGGTFQMSLTVPHFGLLVGTISNGTLNVGGGSTAANVDTASGTVVMGRLESQGVVNLSINGTLKTGGVYNAAFIPGETPGTAIFNFHGGTLAVGTTMQHASFTSFMEGLDHAYIYAEGAIIDTNGRDATIAQNLEAPSGSGIKRIDVGGGGGSGYIGAPLVTISGGSGSGATAIAVMDGDKVDHFVITNPGSGYGNSDILTVTLSGGGFTTPATATIGTGATYFAANVGGGLKKIGAGALSLTGVLSYPGDTIVNEGTLNVTELNTPLATITVKDGAALNAVSLTADTLVIGGVPEIAATAVPEPGTLIMIAAMAVSAGIGAVWRKRKSSR